MQELNSFKFPLSGRLLIEASAGTGKTYTISSLYLRLLLGRDPALRRPLLVSEILVLTFTIAATDELRSRIRDRVILARDIFSGSTDPASDDFIKQLLETTEDQTRDRKILSAALQTMDEAAIFTIHGFCARILSEQSFATGMLFDQSLDADRDVLLQTAAEDCFRQLIMPLEPIPRALALETFKSPEEILRIVKSYVFRHGLIRLPDATEQVDGFEQLVEDNQRCKQLWLEHNITDVITNANFKANSKAVHRIKSNSSMFIEDYCLNEEFDPEQWLPWTSEELLKAKKKSGTRMPEHEIFELIESIYERRDLIQVYRTNLYHQVTDFIQAHMANSKTELGQLTLDDLLSEVHRAVENPVLRRALRQEWPAAMIDEFQDTDDLQFGIFSSIYGETTTNTEKQSQPGSTLLFIGDPKQAIYNFRGADVYTYLNAKLTVDDSYSLGTNWRSTPAMINAVNYLFDKPKVFGESTPIEFSKVDFAAANANNALIIQGDEVAPISVFLDEETTASQYLPNLMNFAAEQTVELLHLGKQGQATINGEPITPGQIAFLVRSGRDARAARQALALRGVRSVYVTQESVFLTETADDLRIILEAVVDPTNEAAIKAAMGTRLMQCSAAELQELSENWSSLHAVMDEFQHYHHLWATLEVAPMIEHLMIRREIPGKWLGREDGERQITNLRHLAEILQHRSMSAPGMRRLLKWFQREKLAADTVAAEDRQLRLESDSNLVQIVTMHVSKGLEYDIVMIPYAGFGEPPQGRMKQQKEATPMFHVQSDQTEGQSGFKSAIDFSADPTSQASARQEDFDESMRLMYVALTRARYRCYLGLPLSRQIHSTPIARLIGFSSNDTESVSATLEALPTKLFTQTKIGQTAISQYEPLNPKQEFVPPRQMPKVSWNWRMHSYTGLTRLLSQTDHPEDNLQPKPAYGDDDVQSDSLQPNLAPSRFTFPRGPKVGIALHSFMEHLSFSASQIEVKDHAKKCLDKMGIEDEEGIWNTVMCTWFTDIVTTPLDSTGIRLNDINQRQRLDEMEFHFPINANQDLIRALKNKQILPDHMEMRINELQGMMTGYIDLIVMHNGKFYLIDYKSNDLGPSQSNYAPDAITEAVRHHHYDLQYLIYTVALNRYLEQRVTDYDYELHFGGVRYLFLRGMDGTESSGVYQDQPDRQLIMDLDQLLTQQASP